MPSNDTVRRYAIEAFDENLNLKWRHDGTFTSEMVVDSGVSSLIAAEPVVHGTTKAEGGGDIVVSAGRQVLIIDPADGTGAGDVAANQLSFDQSVLDVSLLAGGQDDPGFITVIYSGGKADCMELSKGAQDPNLDARRLTLPFPIRWAHITYCEDHEVILAVPANADDRIVSYRTNWTRGQDSGDGYSLDELIVMANQVLAQGGRV